MNGNGHAGGESSTHNFANPVEKFEEAFMNCLAALTKEDTLTNVDKDEIRVDVEQGISGIIESARSMESYFLKKRLEIAIQKPELLVKDDSNELRLELIRKEEMLKKNYEKISSWQSILSDVQSATSGKAPGLGSGQPVPVHPSSLGQQLSQGPHTPQSQGPMTPTGGRPNTPGAGRPQTPGSGGVRIPMVIRWPELKDLKNLKGEQTLNKKRRLQKNPREGSSGSGGSQLPKVPTATRKPSMRKRKDGKDMGNIRVSSKKRGGTISKPVKGKGNPKKEDK